MRRMLINAMNKAIEAIRGESVMRQIQKLKLFLIDETKMTINQSLIDESQTTNW